MRSPLNECIDSRAFAALILDYEYPADDVLPAYVSGRVLIDGIYRAAITATSREELITKFRGGNY